MKLTKTEIVIALLVIALLVFFIDPFMAWMPSAMHLMAVGGLVVLIGLFVGLVWKEQAHDEREELHRFVAARFSYLVGVIVLTIAIAVESMLHVPNVWLVLALGAMILAKLAGSFYARRNR